MGRLEGRRKGLGEGEGYGCIEPSEVSNTHTPLLLSLAHSTHNTQSWFLPTTFSSCICVCVWLCVSVCLVLCVSQ